MRCRRRGRSASISHRWPAPGRAVGEVEAGVEKLFGADPEPPSVMFDTLYAESPAELARQREAALRAIAAAREAKRRS